MSDLLHQIVLAAHDRATRLGDKAGLLLTECSEPLPEEIRWTEYEKGVYHTTNGDPRTEPFEALGAELTKYAKRVVKKGAGKWFMAATTINGGCRDADIESITLLSLDCDGKGDWPVVLVALDEARIAYVAQRSSSHTPEEPKWHLTIPLSRPWTGEKPQWRCIWRFVVGYFAGLAGLTMGFEETVTDPETGEIRPRPHYGFDHTTDRLGQPIFIATKRAESQEPPETIVRSADTVEGQGSSPRLALDLGEFLRRAEFDWSWFEQTPTYEPAGATSIPSDKGLLVLAFGECGMLGQRVDRGTIQGYAVECPYEHLHTTGKRFDTSTIIFDPGPGQTMGWFKCSHSCGRMDQADVLKLLPQEAVTVARSKWKAEVKRSIAEQSRFTLGDHKEIAEELLKELTKTEPLVSDEGALYRYGPIGIWEIVEEAEQSRVIQKFSGELCDGKPLKIYAGDVTGAIKLAGHQAAQAGWFAAAPAGLAFTNGFVRVTSKNGIELVPLGPEHRARTSYKFSYDTSMDAPKWRSFLIDLVRDDSDGLQKIAFLQEFFGACLLGIAPRFQKCILSISPGGGGGRSTLLEIVRELFKGLWCAIAPHKMSGEGNSPDYHRAQLKGMLLNLVAELPTSTIVHSEGFKGMITGDPMSARDPAGKPFTIFPRSGHFFAANHLPRTDDLSSAFFDRFMVLRLNRLFRREVDEKGKSIVDFGIAASIIQSEIPAVAAWLVEGGRRLLQAGKYTVPSSHATELDAWRKNCDQVAAFLEECTTITATSDPITWTSARTLYDRYRMWADANGHKPVMASNTWGSRMKALNPDGFQHTESGAKYQRTLKPTYLDQELKAIRSQASAYPLS